MSSSYAVNSHRVPVIPSPDDSQILQSQLKHLDIFSSDIQLSRKFFNVPIFRDGPDPFVE